MQTQPYRSAPTLAFGFVLCIVSACSTEPGTEPGIDMHPDGGLPDSGPRVDVLGIDISPEESVIELGEQQLLTVTARFADGTMRDVTSEAEFASSDDTVAVVGSEGTVTGLGEGFAVIEALFGNQPAEAELQVLEELVALPGADQQLVLGEKLVLIAGASGASGETTDVWELVSTPEASTWSTMDPSSKSQIFSPDLPGEYRLELSVTDEFRTSQPSAIDIHVLSVAPTPPVRIDVVGVGFSAEYAGLVGPRSEILVRFSGPVDRGSINTETVQLLSVDSMKLSADLLFETDPSVVRLVPRAPLSMGSLFRVRVEDIRASSEPFVFEAWEQTFITVDKLVGRVAGLVLSPLRAPLPGVNVRVGGKTTQTNERGQFLVGPVAPIPRARHRPIAS